MKDLVEENPNELFIKLVDCEHVFTLKAIDQ